MSNKMPRTPFSTHLSGSAKETRMRLEHIASGPKKRPPALFLALVFAACLLCGNLVSCQMEAPEGGDRSVQTGDQSALVRYDQPGEGVRELTLENRWVLALEDTPPYEDGYAQTTALVCQDLETGGRETWASLYYNPQGGAADTIRLYQFEDIMGHSGILLTEHTTGNAPTIRLFLHDGGVPTLLAKCEGTLYTARVDGYDILLSAYPYGSDGRRGGAALYWQEGDGTLRARPLREAVEHFLGLSWEALVSMTLEVREEDGVLTVRWQTEGAPHQTMDLDLSTLLAYVREQAARTQEVPVDHVDGELVKLVLEESRLEGEYDWDTFQVDRILVYRGERLIQTLMPQDWSQMAEYGLFAYSGDGLEPLEQLLDLNCDGVQDFGISCMEHGTRNSPCLYFVWNGAGFTPLDSLCAPVEVDPEKRQIVEQINEGNGVTITRWYEFDKDGIFQRVRSETYDPYHVMG